LKIFTVTFDQLGKLLYNANHANLLVAINLYVFDNKILHVHSLTMDQMNWRTLHQVETPSPWSNSDTGSWN